MRTAEEIARDAAQKFFFVETDAGTPTLFMHSGRRNMGPVDPRDVDEGVLLDLVREDAYEAFLAAIREYEGELTVG